MIYRPTNTESSGGKENSLLGKDESNDQVANLKTG